MPCTSGCQTRILVPSRGAVSIGFHAGLKYLPIINWFNSSGDIAASLAMISRGVCSGFFVSVMAVIPCGGQRGSPINFLFENVARDVPGFVKTLHAVIPSWLHIA